jgi:hypothetical protein
MPMFANKYELTEQCTSAPFGSHMPGSPLCDAAIHFYISE